MSAQMPKKFFIIFFALVFLSAGCEQVDVGPLSTQVSESTYSIDPLFREFYDRLDGPNTLGMAISALDIQGNTKCQYTVGGLMVFDPLLPGPQRVHLAPLGVEMGIDEPDVPAPDQPGTHYINGHIIYADFVPLYEKLGGESVVGKPLTEVHYNPDKKRHEQYFENLGFYILDGEGSDDVHLLAYGAWNCNNKCRGDGQYGIVGQPSVEPPISEAVSRLGSDFTGFPLTEAYIAPDGKVEQIFENVVLVIDLSNPTRVELRPIQQKLSIMPDALTVKSNDKNMFFYAVNGDKGYNIPLASLDYINQHGGFEIFGAPISELTPVKDQVSRQCFVNLCLDRDASGVIRPAPLGYTYKALFYQPVAQSLPEPAPETSREIVIQVWAAHQKIASDKEQEISALITENNKPMVNVRPVLEVSMPDGSQKPYVMPPTGSDGQTHLSISPAQAQNGTLIPYQVCITSNAEKRVCVKDNYLVWNP
jgi:hypothetical protein